MISFLAIGVLSIWGEEILTSLNSTYSSFLVRLDDAFLLGLANENNELTIG